MRSLDRAVAGEATAEDDAFAPEHLDAAMLESFWAVMDAIPRRDRAALSGSPRRATCGSAPHSSACCEGLNSKIRLISHRAFGFHSPDPLIALVYLCCAGITIDLPR